MSDAPDGFRPLADAGEFADLVGPLHVGPGEVLGVRVDERHLNRAGTAMGGFLATLVDAALGRAVRAEADGAASTATVSLTTDYLRPAPAGAWLEARTAVERIGSRLAFADCSVTADGREVVRARRLRGPRGRRGLSRRTAGAPCSTCALVCVFTMASADYGREFPMVEFQQTFYRPPGDATPLRWRRLPLPLGARERPACGSIRATCYVLFNYLPRIADARRFAAMVGGK